MFSCEADMYRCPTLCQVPCSVTAVMTALPAGCVSPTPAGWMEAVSHQCSQGLSVPWPSAHPGSGLGPLLLENSTLFLTPLCCFSFICSLSFGSFHFSGDGRLLYALFYRIISSTTDADHLALF